MRKFIRHPADIPLEFSLDGQDELRREYMLNASCGGLCFHSGKQLERGTNIHVRIPVREPPFELDGVVAWSAKNGTGFEVGVAFDERATQYSLRMVEQICYIEQYRRDVAEKEGRNLNGDQAAREWISMYAGQFPNVG